MTEQLRPRGTLKGHGGWVTQIATTPAVPDMILSASRGKARVPVKARQGKRSSYDASTFILCVDLC